MSEYNSKEITAMASVATTRPTAVAYCGHMKVFRASFTLASQVATDVLNLVTLLPKQMCIVGAIIKSSAAFVTAAVKASGTLTFAANPTDADTVTIGAQVYRFKGTMAAINDIKLGGTLAATLASLVKTINGVGAAGTDYFLGTETPHEKVSAAIDAGNTIVTITALEGGTSGNAIALASSAANAVASGATLANGAAEVEPKIAIGVAGTPAKYAAATSVPVADVPVLVGVASATLERDADEAIIATVSGATLPASGNLVIDLLVSSVM